MEQLNIGGVTLAFLERENRRLMCEFYGVQTLRGVFTVGLPGDLNGNSRLKPEQVWEIRRLAAGGVPMREIAALHGVSKSLVSLISRGKRWGRLPKRSEMDAPPISLTPLTQRQPLVPASEWLEAAYAARGNVS